LGVSDFLRLGALRLSLTEQPERMLAEHQEVPKLVHLPALLAAVGDVERNKQSPAELQMLLYPGSSLGGARPKAVIQDAGALWIAKFPSRTDANRIPLWEKTAMDLAARAGILVPPMRVLYRDTEHPVFLIRRFDRHLLPDGTQQRIHFASAMTLLARQDGDPASWLDLLDAVQQYSAQPQRDASELWRRMVFGMVISNTDDHLRNHGFLRTASGWILSPAYDINFDIADPATRRHALSFDARVTNPSASFALEFTELFGLSATDTMDIIQQIAAAIKEFPMVARQNGLSAEESRRAGLSIRQDILSDLEAFCSNKKQGKGTGKKRGGT
ncbi:HipA domain-containing protein, partial [Candidatus Igneacidithiobacillus taiwanensis]|uniref:type II toxin-antitoxin system HipA family toxin n=1 Tax=Candidatus Igneacidithiobacillus taiwanensis TaxID=1945924 RepID=UPI00289D3C0C